MKLVTLCFQKVAAPDGVPTRDGTVMRKAKFNFVRYSNRPDERAVEPVNASDVMDLDGFAPVGEGVEQFYVEGIELVDHLEATGFDDPRDF